MRLSDSAKLLADCECGVVFVGCARCSCCCLVGSQQMEVATDFSFSWHFGGGVPQLTDKASQLADPGSPWTDRLVHGLTSRPADPQSPPTD